MTVTSQTSDIRYTADGATVTFPVPFAFTSNGDLSVIVQDASGQTLPTPGFTAAGAGIATGGALTFYVAPAAGIGIYICRNPPITQDTSYTDHGRFPAKSHEAALDKLTFLIQYLARLLSSALRRPVGDPLVDMTLPPAAQRAGRVLAFDANGSPVVIFLAALGSCQVSQMKWVLAAAGQFDAVEAALGNLGPTDPATISWETGGPMSLSGPLAAVIATSTGRSANDMAALIATAARVIL